MSTDPATIARIRGLREKKASVNPNLRKGDGQQMAEAISALKLDIFWAPDGPVETEVGIPAEWLASFTPRHWKSRRRYLTEA